QKLKTGCLQTNTEVGPSQKLIDRSRSIVEHDEAISNDPPKELLFRILIRLYMNDNVGSIYDGVFSVKGNQEIWMFCNAPNEYGATIFFVFKRDRHLLIGPNSLLGFVYAPSAKKLPELIVPSLPGLNKGAHPRLGSILRTLPRRVFSQWLLRLALSGGVFASRMH